MYIIKNSIVSITRNIGRNILMGIIILIISCACAITLSIRNSATTLVESYESSNEIIANISINRQKLMGSFEPGSSSKESNEEKFNKIESLTKENIISYTDSSYLKDYYYTYSISMNSSNIEPSSETESNNNSHGLMKNNKRSSADFEIIGYSSYSAMTEFVSGKYTITSGEVFNDFNSATCIINNELAQTNELNVGDLITLVNPKDSTKDYDLTIVGIYTEKDSNEMNMFSSSSNNIITNTTIIENILENNTDIKGTITPSFVLNSEDDIEKFETELTEKGLNEYYTVTTNLAEIENETKSISNLKTYATTFLIITLIIGGVVLLIINMINVRERKYEIGVLRTIGMKKSLVCRQFILELLIVSIISLLIGCGIGSLVSVPTANYLLDSEIQSNKENIQNISNNFGGKDMGNMQQRGNQNNQTEPLGQSPRMGIKNIAYVTEINAIVDFKVLGQLLGIGMLLTLISSLAAVISISRFSPVQILKERT